MKNKVKSSLSIPLSVYWTIILYGIMFTLFSLINNATYSEMSRNLFSVSSNLGTGLLASGILGWILDSITSNKNNEIVLYKRENLLRDLKTLVQMFLNVSCNRYFDIRKNVYNIQNELRQLPVRDIFLVVKQFELSLLTELENCQIVTKEHCEYIQTVFQEDQNYSQLRILTRNILNEKDLYIVNGIFSVEEIELFEMINNCVVKLQELFENKDFIASVAFVDLLYEKLFELVGNIDQFGDLLQLKFVNYTIKNAP